MYLHMLIGTQMMKKGYLSRYIHTNTHTRAYMSHISMYRHTRVCVYIYMILTYVCVCVRMCVYIYTHMYVERDTRIHSCMRYARIHISCICACTSICAYASAHIHTHTCIHVYIHIYTHVIREGRLVPLSLSL